MARPYRIEAKNAFYHITSRGNGRGQIYRKKKDYSKFLEYILKAKAKYNIKLYAYVLMPNHYHLLIQTLEVNLSRVMHYVNGVYTTYFNKVNNHVGHLFQGRFKSIIIEADSYFKELSRYIHLNPVRAGMVEKPEEYMWSSYDEYLNKREEGYIDKIKLETVLGMSIKEYERFVKEGILTKDNVFENVYAGNMLGGKSFLGEKTRELRRQIQGKEIAFKNEFNEKIAPNTIIEYIAAALFSFKFL